MAEADIADRADPADPADPGPRAGRPYHRASPAPKVLIVDDDTTFSASMCRILVGTGYDCSAVASAAAARQHLNDGDLAAVLCDVTIPGEPDLDLLACLASDFPDVAVVMTTDVDDPATAARAYDVGAYGYLIKPFAVNEMLITLASALRRSELEAARRSHLRGLERTVARLKRVHGVVSDIEASATLSSSDGDGLATERLTRALYLGDDEPRAHIERMSRIAAVMAEAVGFDGCSAEEFRRAAALHDVGMVMVPEAILLKPGRLTAEEDRAMQRHTRIGYRLLAASAAPFMRVAASIALGHHEWWDGSGYPRGLRGQDIPLEARIVAVADGFDALTSHRVYRPALPGDAAFAAMTELPGRQFEPRLVDVIGDLLDETEAIRAAYPGRAQAPRIRVVEAIRYVHEGEMPWSVLSRPRLAFQHGPTRPGLGSDLGPRELEVLRLMAAGTANKALASELHLSLNTVRNHVQRILYKLDAHSKLEAVATAVRAGLIEFDDQVGTSRWSAFAGSAARPSG
jgi:putative two-component system response regulator